MKIIAATLVLTLAICSPATGAEPGIITGVASMYWPGSFRWGGPKASDGSRINFNTGATVAHPEAALTGVWAFGTCLLITYPWKRGRTIEVKITDNGPHWKGRILDLTPGIAKYLHFPGLGRITYRKVECSPPPLPRPRPSEVAAISGGAVQ